MYICPTCNRSFKSETTIQKHFLACWRETHPGHRAKQAPRSENIIEREVNDEVMDFFNSFQKR